MKEISDKEVKNAKSEVEDNDDQATACLNLQKSSRCSMVSDLLEDRHFNILWKDQGQGSRA